MAVEELVAAIESGDQKKRAAAYQRASEVTGLGPAAIQTMVRYLVACGFEPAIAAAAIVRC